MAEISLEETKRAADALDALFLLSCPCCRVQRPILTFCSTPINGALPPGDFQCPNCWHAFRRIRRTNPKAWENEYALTEINSIL